MKMTIDYTAYGKEGMRPILEYLNNQKSETMCITFDEDFFVDSVSIILKTLNINNLKIEDDNDERTHHAIFSCTEEVEKNMIKLCMKIKEFGDGGHSYAIKINDKKFSWDGDGSDFITHINGKECLSYNDLKNNFYRYTLSDIQKKQETVEETVNRIVSQIFK